MNPHDDPEQQRTSVSFSDLRCGEVLVSRREAARNQNAPGLDFYLVVVLDKQTRRCLVRDVDGTEFWSPAWAFDSVITQKVAEQLGATWRIAPQIRPGLVGPARHPSGVR